MALLKSCPFSEKLTIMEQDAGLHFLLKINTDLSDRALTEALCNAGIRVHALSHYYHELEQDTHILVVNYALLSEDALSGTLEKLALQSGIDNLSSSC
jgi:GntR family transcriptional regulator/MocR family aminotransferase